MRACNLGSVEVTQQSAEVPHQMASWVIRLAIKTTESGRYQVTIEQFYFWPEKCESGALFMDMAREKCAIHSAETRSGALKITQAIIT